MVNGCKAASVNRGLLSPMCSNILTAYLMPKLVNVLEQRLKPTCKCRLHAHGKISGKQSACNEYIISKDRSHNYTAGRQQQCRI